MNREEFVKAVRETAEGYYERCELFCSEAVLKTINDALENPVAHEVLKAAGGFPVGIGKCKDICGALTGGIMALGVVYGRNYGEAVNEKLLPLSSELYNHIKDSFGGVSCLEIIKNYDYSTDERKRYCVKLTGAVVEFITNKLIDDNKLIIKDVKE